MDEAPDVEFYRYPRLVTHIDAGATAMVTQLYREWFPAGGRVLDLMSSWVSHLPDDVQYAEVVGLGMNAHELAANPRLSGRVVQDLNAEPSLPFRDHHFDAAGVCVSIDYLTDPVIVLADLARVLKPDAPVVITYSNRCFPTKAVALWLQLGDRARGELVAYWLDRSGAFAEPRWFDRSPAQGDPLYAVVARTLPE